MLNEDVETLTLRLESARTMLSAADARLARLTGELAALDQTVVLYDNTLNPKNIAPINAWQGNYGKRGALRGFLVLTLRSRSPDYVTTQELEILTITNFSLVFEHRALRRHWYMGSFRGTLKVLLSRGLIERGSDDLRRSQETGTWRWKQETQPTLAELRNAS
jgi:hypothetical protein